MSTTKAHAFRQAQARSANPPKAKQPKHEATAGTTGADARRHAGRRGGAVLEPPATVGAKPSRKSTRKSVDHTKRTTNQQLEASREASAPSARASRGARTTHKVTGR
jgi:hypothetical protein